MKKSRLRLVFLDAATFGDVSFESFMAQWDCALHETSTSAEVLDRVGGTQAVVINKIVLDRSVLASPKAKSLQLIVVAATGTDNVDLKSAGERGITVCNVPGYATNSVAQFTIALILELASYPGRYAQLVRSGAWQKSQIFTRLDFPSIELTGKKLGIVGYGSIGRAVAHIARGFGMEVLVSARPGTSGPVPSGRLPFADLLTTADFVTLHCPLTPQTKSLMDRRALALMKPTAFLINTARGDLVNEEALVEALKNKRLGGAAVDVLTEEPPPENHPLIRAARDLDNLLVTPHCAWTAMEARQRLLKAVEENIKAFQRGDNRTGVP
jgi:glycerate dehydrogenase